MSIVLGQGSYGAVVKRGGYAVKKFSKLSHCVQEATASFYLRGHPQIVEGVKCDVAAKELTMQLCSYSLTDWMHRYVDAPDDVKMSLLKEICLGLQYIHSLHCMHADLKPGNILVWHDKNGYPHIRIGDLGFVCLCPYAKAERTARAYRAQEVITAPSHDMFSLGVIIFELFSGYRIRKRATHAELQKAAGKYITDKKIRAIAVRLLDGDANLRPSCAEVMRELFSNDCDTVSEWSGDPDRLSRKQWNFYDETSTSSEDSIEVSVDTMKHIRDMMKALAMKEINPLRVKKGCKALLLYISTKGIHSDDYLLHITAMIILISSNFSTDPFSESRAARACKRSKKEVLVVLQRLIETKYVIDMIMSPY